MKNLVMMGALAALAGCGGGKFEGIWFLEEGAPVAGDFDEFCDTDVSENYVDGVLNEPEEGEVDYVDETVTDLSNSGYFVQVLEGKGKNAFVVMDDIVYPAKIDKKQLTVKWTHYENSEREGVHELGYEFTHDVTRETNYKLVMNLGKKGAVTAKRTVETISEDDWTETDRWRPEDVEEVGGTQVPSTDYLVPQEEDENTGHRNRPDEEDCSGGTCELNVRTVCNFPSPKIKGNFVGNNDDGMYSSIEDATLAGGSL